LPGAVVEAAVIVMVLVVEPLATDVGENAAVTPVGAPSRLRLMLLAKPPDRETVAVTVPLAPCARLSDVGETLIPIAGVGFVPVSSLLPPHAAAAAIAMTRSANFLEISRALIESYHDLTATSWWVVLN
jgi:hypothetical protein